MNALGRCVACTSGNHDKCDSPGSRLRCECCPDAVELSDARRMAMALNVSATTNNQGEGSMATKATATKVDARQKSDGEKATQVAKRAARPNVAAKKAAPKVDNPASVIEPVAPKAEAPKADAKPTVEKFDACPLCGYVFSEKQGPSPKCKNPVACQRRVDGKPQRGMSASPNGNGNGATTPKGGTITAMNIERQAVKDWEAAGSIEADRPTTPLLDKVRADYAAKEAAKAAKAEARNGSKEVTPILKAVK